MTLNEKGENEWPRSASDAVLMIPIRDGDHLSPTNSSTESLAAIRSASLALAASLLLPKQLQQRSKSQRRQSHAPLPRAERTGKVLTGNDPASALNVLTNGLIGAASVFEITPQGGRETVTTLNCPTQKRA